MAEINELHHCSLAVNYELDNSFDSEKFIKMRCRVCHDGINPNGSKFFVDGMERAANSIANIPILANVVFDDDGDPQFGGHDMHIEKDKVHEDEFRMVYQEVPIGVVPESNNYSIEEYDGRNYVYCDAYIWRGYSNYATDIIERDKDINLSMEINVNEFSFNAKEKVYNITDYKYTGITFLGNDIGTGMKKAKATTETFANKDTTEQMLVIMQELKDALAIFNNKNTEEGGIVMNDEIKSTEITEPVVEQETSENAEEVAEKETYEVNQVEETEDTEVVTEDSPVTDYVKTFTLSHEDIRCALYKLLEAAEVANEDAYYVDAVYDDCFDYCSYRERKMFRQSYTKSGDDIVFAGEPFEVFVVKVTADEKASLDSMKSNYANMETELNTLREYKAGVEKAAVDAQKDDVISKWSEILKDNEQFAQLKSEIETYSVDELDVKCKCIFADSKANFTFSAKSTPKEQSVVRIPVAHDDEPAVTRSPYGDLFEKFGK